MNNRKHIHRFRTFRELKDMDFSYDACLARGQASLLSAYKELDEDFETNHYDMYRVAHSIDEWAYLKEHAKFGTSMLDTFLLNMESMDAKQSEFEAKMRFTYGQFQPDGLAGKALCFDPRIMFCHYFTNLKGTIEHKHIVRTLDNGRFEFLRYHQHYGKTRIACDAYRTMDEYIEFLTGLVHLSKKFKHYPIKQIKNGTYWMHSIWSVDLDIMYRSCFVAVDRDIFDYLEQYFPES